MVFKGIIWQAIYYKITIITNLEHLIFTANHLSIMNSNTVAF